MARARSSKAAACMEGITVLRWMQNMTTNGKVPIFFFEASTSTGLGMRGMTKSRLTIPSFRFSRDSRTTQYPVQDVPTGLQTHRSKRYTPKRPIA